MRQHTEYKKHGKGWTVTVLDCTGKVLSTVRVEGANKREAEAAYARLTLTEKLRRS